ncbi:MAG: hypothetical protein GQ545_03500 [Candidatus Aminicenantes bacterium]|nr:hypothetical protein [Candidatus Aminicenantes bacterium]
MLKQKVSILHLLLYLSFLVCSLTALTLPYSQEKRSKDLEGILDKCAVYCEKLASASLFFVCTERIEEEINEINLVGYSRRIDAKKVEGNTYVYDYQLMKKGNRIEEKRILLEENGKKKYEKNAQLKTRMFYSKRSVFGPVGLLIRKNHDKYIYKILDEKSIGGRKTIVIEAKPKSEMRDLPNYGKLWVDKEDYSILKIEVAEESLVGIEQVKKTSKLKSTPMISVTHYYDEVYKTDKNQVIRFPSKTVFLYEKHLYKRGYREQVIVAKTQFIYDNYKFFTVDVDVKY